MTVDEMLSAAEHVSRYSPSPSAELITGLANAVRQMAAENAALTPLIAENWNMHDVLRQLIAARPGGVYFNKWEALILRVLNEQPATDAAIAALREEARADAFSYAADSVRHEIICLKERSPRLKEMACLANEFDSMARQLRESKGEVQS